MMAGIAAGAIGLLALAVGVALLESGVPSSFADRPATGAVLIGVLLAAFALGVTRLLIERRRGTNLLESRGGVWRLAFAIVLFQLALLLSLLAAGLIAGLVAVAGWSPRLQLRACGVLLVGGVFFTILAGGVRDLLLLVTAGRDRSSAPDL